MPYPKPYAQLTDAQKQRLRQNAKRWNQTHREQLRLYARKHYQLIKAEREKNPRPKKARKPPTHGIDWAPYRSEILSRYAAGESPLELSRIFPFKRGTIKEFIRREGAIRNQSDAAKMAASRGRSDKALVLLAKLNREDPAVRFNPAKTPWRRDSTLHPKWIADRSLLKHPRSRTELRVWRRAVFERDSYSCQICGQRGGQLNADHIKAYRNFPALREDVSNGRTLCVACHKQTPNYGARAKKDL